MADDGVDSRRRRQQRATADVGDVDHHGEGQRGRAVVGRHHRRDRRTGHEEGVLLQRAALPICDILVPPRLQGGKETLRGVL